LINIDGNDEVIKRFSEIITDQDLNNCHTLILERTFEHIFTLEQIMFRLALLMKYLPNAKRIQIISNDLMNILCYLLVLPQTEEKYGKLQILFL
jgi:hypothetical protein